MRVPPLPAPLQAPPTSPGGCALRLDPSCGNCGALQYTLTNAQMAPLKAAG